MNKLIKLKIISAISISIISFIVHFIYPIFPNIITSIFFPVNESIFEHMKIIITSTILYSPIEYFLLKKQNISINNFKSSILITSFIGIILYLIIYLPINHKIGEYLPLSIFILIIVYIIMQIVSYFLLKSKNIPYLNQISIPLIILIYIIFTILTYYPPKIPFFYDTTNNIYGINPLTKK